MVLRIPTRAGLGINPRSIVTFSAPTNCRMLSFRTVRRTTVHTPTRPTFLPHSVSSPGLTCRYKSVESAPKTPLIPPPASAPTSAPSTPSSPSASAAQQAPVKHPRSGSGTSLRRVAVEAERSLGGYLRQRGDHQFVDPNVVTKKVTGYCAAERYNISKVARLVRQDGFVVDPLGTGLYPQVVHVQTPVCSPPTHDQHQHQRQRQQQQPGEDGAAPPTTQPGDVFIFPSGTVVAWNVPQEDCVRLVTKVLLPAAEHPQSIEQDNLEYLEDPSKESSSVVGDTIVLGTHDAVPSFHHPIPSSPSSSSSSPPSPPRPHSQPVTTTLTKIAFSSGLARSTKLQVLESLLERYFESTKDIPSVLSRGQRLPFGRRWVLRKTGELLHIRAQLNLYSELTDSLPDLFWDSRHSLGLEDYFENLGRALDVGVRIKLLNQRMDYAQEMATVLREQLSEKHGLRLEWGIIFLILVEVLFECRSLWKEYRDDGGRPNSPQVLSDHS